MSLSLKERQHVLSIATLPDEDEYKRLVAEAADANLAGDDTRFWALCYEAAEYAGCRELALMVSRQAAALSKAKFEW